MLGILANFRIVLPAALTFLSLSGLNQNPQPFVSLSLFNPSGSVFTGLMNHELRHDKNISKIGNLFQKTILLLGRIETDLSRQRVIDNLFRPGFFQDFRDIRPQIKNFIPDIGKFPI